jgi:excinuclease ABC subunit A
LLHRQTRGYRGVFPFLRALESKRYKQYIRVFLRQYQLAHACPSCGGARLRAEALAVRVGDRSIADVAAETAADVADWLRGLALSPFEREVAESILVGFLCDVGLGYLSLDRQTRTLSGGEAQRIALANALGANLVDTLYVLDEPSIGLHPRDIHREADHMIELGPGSGEAGGQLVYAGSVEGAEADGTLTGQYLAGTKRIAVPSVRRRAGPRWLSVTGARLHNLQGVDASVPLGTLTAVTGVSGSGKSTLVHDVLYRQLAARIRGRHGAKEHLGEQVGHVDDLTGWEGLDDVVLVDQSPIGRTPRSNPVTYVRAFDEIRSLFASQPLSRARGYTPATFSFNASDGGRCRQCDGAGHLQVEMVFLADVFIPCEACEGTRFQPEVLDVRIKGLSIHDVLNLTVDQAIVRFRHQERLGKALWYLQQVGLGYLRLGQPATTLSGGEAQRLKIARQLATLGKRASRRLYILDEPTTGLHLDDVRTLLKVLERLVDAGHTVLGGVAGGRVVASGTPEDLAQQETPTGRYLREVLETEEAVATGKAG